MAWGVLPVLTGTYTGLGRDLLHRQIGEVIKHERAALLGGLPAQRLDEGNAIGAGAGMR